MFFKFFNTMFSDLHNDYKDFVQGFSLLKSRSTQSFGILLIIFSLYILIWKILLPIFTSLVNLSVFNTYLNYTHQVPFFIWCLLTVFITFFYFIFYEEDLKVAVFILTFFFVAGFLYTYILFKNLFETNEYYWLMDIPSLSTIGLSFFNIELFFICDILSGVFLILTHFLLCICLVLVLPTLKVDSKGYLNVLSLILLWLQLVVTFTAGNAFIFFFAFESLMIPLLFLIGIWGSINRVQASYYLYFYTAIGAIGMLIATLYLWKNMGTTSFLFLSFSVEPFMTWNESFFLWLGFFFSFAIKTPLVPFHIWLPKAHVEAPTTGSVLLAGLLLKVGLYGFLRICLNLFPGITAYAAPFVVVFASIGIIYASLITLRQIDMKRIIAYSSVAHMSLALISVMTDQMLGIAAGVFLSLSHGIVSSSLFILVGALYARFHNRLVSYYGGLITFMPYFGGIFFFFSLANMAFPLTSGFIGEFLCLTAILSYNTLIGFLAALSMLFSTVYSILLFNRVFLGNLKLNFHTSSTTSLKCLDLTSSELLILTPCVLITVYFGVFPASLFLNYTGSGLGGAF